MRLTIAEIMAGVEFTKKKRIENNTVEYLRPNGNRVIRLHKTDIVEFFPDKIVLATGGWRTVTTKDRINKAIQPRGWYVSQRNSLWFVRKNNEVEWPFVEGMALLDDGTVEGSEVDGGKGEKARLTLKKKIKEYVAKYIVALFDKRTVPAPSSGDCWFCCLRDKSGIPWGESRNDTEHLLNHMKQNYFVPSLLIRGIEVYPQLDPNAALFQELARLWNPELAGRKESFYTPVARRQATHILKRYLYKQFGFVS